MARESKGFIVAARWTCWAQDERNHRMNRGEQLIVTGARHVLYEFAALATPEPGYIPNDDKRLAAVLGISLDEWREIKPEIVCDWKETPKGWLIRRINGEMRAAETLRLKKSNGGKAAARNRQSGQEIPKSLAGHLPGVLPAVLPGDLPAQPQDSSEERCKTTWGSTSTIPNPQSPIPEEREEKQRGGPELRGAKPRHRALISEEREPEPEAADRLRELWPKSAVAEAMKASNETADAHRVGRADLNRWVVLQRQQRRHPRAVTAALKAATARGPSEIRNLTAWLNTTTTAESPNEHAKDAEGKAAGYREENKGATVALFGEGTTR